MTNLSSCVHQKCKQTNYVTNICSVPRGIILEWKGTWKVLSHCIGEVNGVSYCFCSDTIIPWKNNKIVLVLSLHHTLPYFVLPHQTLPALDYSCCSNASNHYRKTNIWQSTVPRAALILKDTAHKPIVVWSL